MTTSALRAPLATPSSNRRRLPLLEHYLREQQTLTAVDRFARRHDRSSTNEQRYEELLPGAAPADGQQYAFRVDLDACTGCKACVTACHNLNGLDGETGETWRSVGLLHGGTAADPVKQTVTTACHHCVDPACMNGCPVGAYEKDPKTGIVRHLDDQCIGCQYCTFTCPYEVPQYSGRLGIVRKCDMCTDRLAHGEAPACVQGCPNDAIAITIVEKRQAIEDAQGDAFLPGAPSPGITVPTTVYETKRALPRNMLPASFYAVTPAHRHLPLVVMLVLTQLSVGAFVVDTIASHTLASDVRAILQPVHSVVALSIGLIALGASVLHLGRPRYAFRAVIGLRTSWMSREIVAFGVFAPLAMVHAASCWCLYGGALPSSVFGARRDWAYGPVLERLHEVLGDAVALAGIAGVFCSVLIYHATRRAWWAAHLTGFKFGLTTILLGVGTTLVTFSAAPLRSGGLGAVHGIVVWLWKLLLATTLLKTIGELAFFRHLRDRRYTDLKRSAVLMKGDLGSYTQARFAAIAIGGVVIPLLGAYDGGLGATIASLVLLVVGELLERTLFFAAASSRGMPGGLP